MRSPSPARCQRASAGHQFTATKVSSVVDVSHCYRRHSQEQHQDSADGRLLPPKAAAEIKEETFSEECHEYHLA